MFRIYVSVSGETRLITIRLCWLQQNPTDSQSATVIGTSSVTCSTRTFTWSTSEERCWTWNPTPVIRTFLRRSRRNQPIPAVHPTDWRKPYLWGNDASRAGCSRDDPEALMEEARDREEGRKRERERERESEREREREGGMRGRVEREW